MQTLSGHPTNLEHCSHCNNPQLVVQTTQDFPVLGFWRPKIHHMDCMDATDDVHRTHLLAILTAKFQREDCRKSKKKNSGLTQSLENWLEKRLMDLTSHGAKHGFLMLLAFWPFWFFTWAYLTFTVSIWCHKMGHGCTCTHEIREIKRELSMRTNDLKTYSIYHDIMYSITECIVFSARGIVLNQESDPQTWLIWDILYPDPTVACFRALSTQQPHNGFMVMRCIRQCSLLNSSCKYSCIHVLNYFACRIILRYIALHCALLHCTADSMA